MDLDYKMIGKRVKIARSKPTRRRNSYPRLWVSPPPLSNIETGTTRVSLVTIVKLANALTVTVDDLLCDSVVRAKPQIERDIAGLLENCDDYEIRMVRDMAQALVETLRRDANLRK